MSDFSIPSARAGIGPVSAGSPIMSGVTVGDQFEALVELDRLVRATRLRCLWSDALGLGPAGVVGTTSGTGTTLFQYIPVTLSAAQTGEFIALAHVGISGGTTGQVRLSLTDGATTESTAWTDLESASGGAWVDYTWVPATLTITSGSTYFLQVELRQTGGGTALYGAAALFERDLEAGDL